MTAPKGNGGNGGGSDQTAALRVDIERTRGDMSRTVNEIEERLSPAHLKEQFASVTAGITSDVEQKVAELKESVMGGYHEARDQLKDDLGREIRGARHMVSDEITHARAAVREATVGRVEHMVHDARESVTDAGTSVLDTIKANPIPAALIGVGLGWLLLGSRSNGSSRAAARTMNRYRNEPARGYGYGPSYGYAEGRDEGNLTAGPRRAIRQGQRAVGNAVHAAEAGVANLGQRVQEGASQLVEGAQGAVKDAGESVSHFAQDAGHRVAETAGGARDAAMHLAEDARVRGQRAARGAGRQIMRAERGIESTLRENPLALGAIAIAIGAAIGLSLPHTEVEDEWMGDAKDRLMNKAEGYAGEAIHKAEDAVGQLSTGEKSEAKPENKQEGKPASTRDLSNGLGAKSQAV